MNFYNTNPLVMLGRIAGRRTQLLIDSGASLTLINQHLFSQLPLYYQQRARSPPPNLYLQLADRSRLHVKYAVSVPITISNSTRTHTVYVVPQLWRTSIIGNDLIRKHNLQIDGGRQYAYFKETQRNRANMYTEKEEKHIDENYTLLANERVKIKPFHAFNLQVRPNKPFINTNEDYDQEEYEITSLKQTPCVANGIITPQNQMTVQVANLTGKTIIIHLNQPLAKMTRLDQSQINMIQHGTSPSTGGSCPSPIGDEPNLNKTDLQEDQKEKIKQLIRTFPGVFSDQPGRTTKLQHQIKLLPGSQPYNSPPFRYAPARRQVIEDNLKEMTDQGIISPSQSPWAAPVILAPKKDGSLRFCIDYRKLNTMTVRDAYPIPRIDDTLDSLQEAKFVSTLDLRSGYWQVEMDKNSRDKTAFVTHKGLFQFNVMPFGLTNAPATFQRLMDIVLAGLKWQCCLVYIDDVVIYSPTFEQHLVDLKNVFEALKTANLTLKASKCQFCRPEMRYLGHIITQQGIKPDPDLIKSVTHFPQPKKIKDVQSFLGLTGYYRKFIRNYAKIAEPLLKQLRDSQRTNHHLQWTPECTHAFETLKKKLTNAPIMNTPNFEHPFILELDACEYGLGAVLAQEYDGGKHVIAYGSRTLSTAERKYGATEREALAIVWATKHFRPYLEGNRIFIRSDCKALEWMRNAKDVTGRLARWAMKLAAFQIEEIKYRPGNANANADSLSRNPLPNEIFYTSELSTIETAINLWENTNILDNIRTEQNTDTKLLPIIQCLQTKPPNDPNEKRNPYALINGLLYKIKNSSRQYNQRVLGNKHLLVIPKSMQRNLLQWAHDHPTAGHSGQQKTLFRLTTRVFWESMRKDVYNYVMTCDACQQFKYNNAPSASPMQTHSVTEPWHTIGIDIMGPFPTTSRNKRFLLVIVDYFTRWIEIFPISTTTSMAISELLTDQVFTRYGLPKYILSDNGPQFISNLFQDFCKTLKIQQKLTANYHPQSNMTERVNRSLKPLIAIYAQRQPQSWDREIQKLAFAIRTSINDTTGETPAFLMFGRDIKGPMDLMVGEPTDGPPPQTLELEHIQDYKTRLINNLRCAFNVVLERSEIEKHNQKRKYDQHITSKKFTVGDLVWVAIPTNHIGDHTIGNKLRPHYDGPCRLMKQLSPITFIVRRIRDDVDLGATNADRLKPYYKLEDLNPETLTSMDQSREHYQQENEETNQNQAETTTKETTTQISTTNYSSYINTTGLRPTSTRIRRKPIRYEH